MFNTKPILYIIITGLVLAVLFAGCASPTQPQPTHSAETQAAPPKPTETQPPKIEPTLSFVTHEGARDIAVKYLAEKYGLEPPTDWTLEDKTPQNLVGLSAFQYTSADWVVYVEAPVVAPEYLLYTLKIDHVASGLHWEGEVDAGGSITEKAVTPPGQVWSPQPARIC